MNMQDKKLVYFLVGLPILIFTLFIGIYVGKHQATSVDTSGLTNGTYVTSDEFNAFWKAWSVLNEKHVAAASTSVMSRIYGSIQGLASAYGDPYTVFFPPAESKVFHEDIAGNFEGIGMEIAVKNKQLTVVAPLKGSPAEAAGIKGGDFVMAINGTSTAQMTVDDAVKYIRGPGGTKVRILFLIQGTGKPVEKTITRAVINIPTLDTEAKADGIFRISLYSFTADSPNLFREALRKFVLSGDHKLILDLRGNPGGYLDAAWDMASWFLPAGATVVTEDFGKNAPPNIYRSKGYNVFNKNLQMVVLVDGGSASAAEILAGALQEQGAAKLVGAKTFGKGSVQELVPITMDTSLKVTIARWLTPKGHNLSHDGLDPDYPIAITDADIAAKHDSQMAKAVDLLTAAP